jgi:3-hydroxyisobutyrate dehydrogenase
MSQSIGFVGVGRMGANMARRLKEQGHAVTVVYDQAQSLAAEVAQELGATHATSLAAVTAAADVVITVVTDDAAQLGIFAESGDSLLTEATGTTFINCATITPATHVEIERRASAAGAAFLEACI